MFTVSKSNDNLTWDEGKVTGSEESCIDLQVLAFKQEGQPVGFPMGPVTLTDHLDDPLSALYFMLQILGPEATITGEAPTVPPLPAGTVS